MIPRSTHHRIQIATAAEVAARLPFPARKEGASRYRTRGVCHGSADKPDSASLIFHDPDRPGEQSLRVHCYKCSPRTPAERDAIRHALQKATGLQLCLCPDCRQAHYTTQDSQPRPQPQQRPKKEARGSRRSGPQNTRPRASPADDTDRCQTAGLGCPHVAPRRRRCPLIQDWLPTMPAAGQPDRMEASRSTVPQFSKQI